MPCSNAVARLWSARAVMPALTPSSEFSAVSDEKQGGGRRRLRPRGMADVLGMLGAWCEERWGDEEGSVCEECLEFLREEWTSEAKAIWSKMDGWVEEIEKELRERAEENS